VTTIYRDVGDTGPALTSQLLVGGSPFTLTGASVICVIAGTVGLGANATYQRFVLAATWTAASLGAASVAIPMNPSSLAPNNYPCATAGRYNLEIRGVDANGIIYQWPGRQAIPFIVRPKL
jgi:hypothetical protein